MTEKEDDALVARHEGMYKEIGPKMSVDEEAVLSCLHCKEQIENQFVPLKILEGTGFCSVRCEDLYVPEPTLEDRLARIIVGAFNNKMPPPMILAILGLGFEKADLLKANSMAQEQVREAMELKKTAVVMPPEKKVIQ